MDPLHYSKNIEKHSGDTIITRIKLLQAYKLENITEINSKDIYAAHTH